MKPCLVHFKGTEANAAVASIQVKTCSPVAGRPWNMFFIKLARPVALLAFSFSGLLMLSRKIGYHLIANRTFGAKLSCGFFFFFVVLVVVFHSTLSDSQLCVFFVSFHGTGGLYIVFTIHLQRASGMCLLHFKCHNHQRPNYKAAFSW